MRVMKSRRFTTFRLVEVHTIPDPAIKPKMYRDADVRFESFADVQPDRCNVRLPPKRTSAAKIEMSAKGHEQTSTANRFTNSRLDC